MGLFGILLGLGLLVWLAYRGWSILLLAPGAALIAAAFAGGPTLPYWTQTFMDNASRFIAQFFPLFLLGALFGKLMEDSGSVAAIASFMTEKLGPQRAILTVVLAGALVTYGGVSLFVAIFVLVPMAQAVFRTAEHGLRHRHQHKDRDKEADAAVSDQRAGKHDSKDCALRPQLLCHETGDRGDRTAVLHQLAEQRPKQEQREKLRDKARRVVHEGLRPVGERRPSRESGGDQGRPGCQQQDAPAPIRQPDEEPQAEQDTEQSHPSNALQQPRCRRRSAVQVRAMYLEHPTQSTPVKAPCAPPRCARKADGRLAPFGWYRIVPARVWNTVGGGQARPVTMRNPLFGPEIPPDQLPPPGGARRVLQRDVQLPAQRAAKGKGDRIA